MKVKSKRKITGYPSLAWEYLCMLGSGEKLFILKSGPDRHRHPGSEGSLRSSSRLWGPDWFLVWHVDSNWPGVASRHSTSRSILTSHLVPWLLSDVTCRDPLIPRSLELLMWPARISIARGSRGLQVVWRVGLCRLAAQAWEDTEYCVSSLHTSCHNIGKKSFQALRWVNEKGFLLW